MTTLIIDPLFEAKVLEERRASGGDRYDEVWDGVYVMSPMANDEHLQIGTRLAGIYDFVLGWEDDCQVRAGVNVSDRRRDWKSNYRVPEVAVFLAGTKALNLQTHWVGGPDQAVEVTSPGDRSREKLPFYEKVGTVEVLVIGRTPWSIELYQRKSGKLKLTGRSTPSKPTVLTSKVLPLTYSLLAGKPRPKILVTHRQTGQTWRV